MSRIVHFCYGGTSGSSRVALNISAGSASPASHAYVFYGTGGLKEDYTRELENRGCRYDFVAKKPGMDLRCYLASARAILKLQPEVAIFHGYRSLPVLLALRAKAHELPVIAVQHGPVSELVGIRKFAAATFGADAQATVAVSNMIAGRIRSSLLLRLACRPLRTIPNGVDAEFWCPQGRSHNAVGPMRVGMTGTLTGYRDHPTLIRAIAGLAEQSIAVELELIGAGPDEEKLRILAGELGVHERVRFLGDLAQEDVRDAMRRWDVLVHSTRSEGLSLAVLEGMMLALPIVGSDVDGVREAIGHDGSRGILFGQGDASALCRCLAELAHQPDLRRRLGEAGREHASKHFSIRPMAEAYEALVTELVGDEAAAAD